MKLLHVAAAAALIAGSQACLAAGGPLDISTGSVGFSNTPTALGFTDTYTFSLPLAGTISGSITAVVNGAQDVDFVGIFLTGPSGVFTFTQLLADPFETWGLSPVAVAAGSYTLSLIGTNSPAIGSYGGNLAVTLVPEPEPYALLLAGMAVVGLLSRRRIGS